MCSLTEPTTTVSLAKGLRALENATLGILLRVAVGQLVTYIPMDDQALPNMSAKTLNCYSFLSSPSPFPH